MGGSRIRSRIAIVALSVSVLVPVALAAGDSGKRPAQGSAGLRKAVKKLRAQVRQLQVTVGQLAARQPGGGPPGQTGPQGPPGQPGQSGPAGSSSGSAGGDLTGAYPDPLIAADAVTGTEVLDGSLGGADVGESSLQLSDLAATIFEPPRNPGSMASGACTSEISSAPVVEVGDLVVIVPPDTMPSGFAVFGEVVDTEDSAEFRICNFSGATVDPPNMIFSAFLLRE